MLCVIHGYLGIATYNHGLTPIINACEYAANMGFIETAVYYAIKDLRSKSCYTANEDSEVIYLTEEHMNKLLKFYDEDTEIRRKEYIEMFLLSFHCCGLRVVSDRDKFYNARISATKCINQALKVVGDRLDIPFSLTMHKARHTFAVWALNKGTSISVISRLLGHESTGITEKVYAQFLTSTLAEEVEKLKFYFLPSTMRS